MEMKEILNNKGIVGVINNYQNSLNKDGLIKDLDVKNISNALKMVELDDSYLDKKLEDLTISELWKIDLITKLDKDIIIVGNLSKCLNNKELEYIKKLLIKLNTNYNKKIIVMDKNINVFFNLVKTILVMQDKEIVYQTDNLFDNELYNYVKMPKIVDFVKYVQSKDIELNENIEIYELIKDIYRRVS